ncbi:MAG TPA: MFS transporter [Gemmataceae bacterium]|nr:MFS transporter [Gemmataceae bacterium]
MGTHELLGQQPQSPTQATGMARPTRVRYQVLAVASSVAVVAYLHRVGFSRALPALHLSSVEDGWLLAAFLVAYGGFEMPCGVLGDRLGTRHLLTLLVLGSSLVTAAVGLVVLVPHVWLLPILFLLLVRFLFGTFQAGGFPLLSRMMTDWMPSHERASAQGAIWMASRAGGLIAPLFLGWLLGYFGDWKMPLVIVGALGLLWCAGFWPWFRNRPEEMPAVNAAERQLIIAGRNARPLGHDQVPWGKMLRSRSVWGLCLMYGCGGFAANFYVTMLSSYLDKQRHLSGTQVSWLAALPFAPGMAACIAGGLFSDWMVRRSGNRKWSRRLNGLLSLVLGALGWLTINWVDGPVALALVLCFIFLCNDLNMGPAWAACADIGERYAGTVGGAMNMIGAFAGAGGMLMTGYLFAQGQPGLVFIIYACSFALGSLCWLLVDVTQPLEADHSAAESPILPAEPEP